MRHRIASEAGLKHLRARRRLERSREALGRFWGFAMGVAERGDCRVVWAAASSRQTSSIHKLESRFGDIVRRGRPASRDDEGDLVVTALSSRVIVVPWPTFSTGPRPALLPRPITQADTAILYPLRLTQPLLSRVRINHCRVNRLRHLPASAAGR